MITRRIYIAGPVSGRIEEAKTQFAATTRIINATGHIAVNPLVLANTMEAEAEVKQFGKDAAGRPGWRGVMRRCLLDMLECDEVVLLPGWHRSTGAKFEAMVARTVGIPVTIWSAWAP